MTDEEKRDQVIGADASQEVADELGVSGDGSVLFQRLKQIAERKEATANWFRMWMPAALAAQKLAMTLFTLARHITSMGAGAGLEPIPEDLRTELKEEFASLREKFPDAADVIFGMEHIDAVLSGMLDDEVARGRVIALGRSLQEMADSLIARFIDLAMRPEGLSFSAERLTGYFESLEKILQQLLDRWIFPMVLKDQS